MAGLVAPRTNSASCLSFVPFLASATRKPRDHASHHARMNQRPQTSIPSGARLEIPSEDLTCRLENLKFGYEDDQLWPSACKVRYRCRFGHVINCRSGTMACRKCPTCAAQMSTPQMNQSRRKLTLCELGALANSRGGELLSTEYVNSRTPLLWRCEKGHLWKSNASNIRSAKSWCPECARQRRKSTLEDMHMLARERGGQCLSDEYISEHVKLKWRCAQGHEFWLAPNNMKRTATGARKPSWCKLCRTPTPRRRTRTATKQKGVH